MTWSQHQALFCGPQAAHNIVCLNSLWICLCSWLHNIFVLFAIFNLTDVFWGFLYNNNTTDTACICNYSSSHTCMLPFYLFGLLSWKWPNNCDRLKKHFPVIEEIVIFCEMSHITYLCEVGVGIEATLVASLAATLRAGVKVGLVIPGAHQVGGFADRAQLAAGHWCNLWHRVRGHGDAASVRGHRGGPPSPAASHIHLQTLPSHVATRARNVSLRRSMLKSVMRGQSVPCPMTTLGGCFRTRLWHGRSSRDSKEGEKLCQDNWFNKKDFYMLNIN